MPTITYKDQPLELPARLRNSHLMRFEEHGGNLAKFGEAPATNAITLAAVLLDLPGKPADHADDLPEIADLVDALTPIVQAYSAKKAPAAGPSPLPAAGTPGA